MESAVSSPVGEGRERESSPECRMLRFRGRDLRPRAWSLSPSNLSLNLGAVCLTPPPLGAGMRDELMRASFFGCWCLFVMILLSSVFCFWLGIQKQFRGFEELGLNDSSWAAVRRAPARPLPRNHRPPMRILPDPPSVLAHPPYRTFCKHAMPYSSLPVVLPIAEEHRHGKGTFARRLLQWSGQFAIASCLCRILKHALYGQRPPK